MLNYELLNITLVVLMVFLLISIYRIVSQIIFEIQNRIYFKKKIDDMLRESEDDEDGENDI